MGLLVNKEKIDTGFEFAAGSTKKADGLLIVVDMQQGFSSLSTDLILNDIKRIIPMYSYTFFTKLILTQDSKLATQPRLEKLLDPDEQEFMKNMIPDQVKIIEHKNFSIINNEILEFIKEKKINKVYLAGVSTETTILKAVFDLLDHEIDVFVVKNCINSINGQEMHLDALRLIRNIISDNKFINSDQL